ncbi:hypothetical protein SELMODRAFT_422325 [Selaginella moellendorffii]|uniref:Uncharacterized protein n=1 Tax=Selaginella moellendorffii TaxID=88036 RepID=D8SI20_SELML|nr:hypothetical protein SELMODRAFT_422325 [Selaginella moellendorffii]
MAPAFRGWTVWNRHIPTFRFSGRGSSTLSRIQPRGKEEAVLEEPSWLFLIKATLESLQNRQEWKVLKSEELKEKSGCYLANSRVLFSVQEVEDSHAHERRSTRLRILIKGEEAVADCPKSLTQPFIIDSSRLEVEVDPEASGIAPCVDGCLAYPASESSVSASEVTQFMQDSGLYHVGYGILERVSSSGID